jgi:hypothetical protein
MSIARDGGCQCGKVRYRFEGEPIVLTVCHCAECQRQSGSAFGMSLTVRKQDFRLLSGELKTFTRSADSGRLVHCAFCPECGTRIYHQPEYRKESINIKPGTLDDTSWLTPSLQVWTVRRHAWVELTGEIAEMERQPG